MAPTASSIKAKLRSMILLTSATVLLLTSAAFVTYEVVSFKQGLVRHVSVLAQVVADNTAAALAFDVASDASQVLSALKAEPGIMNAQLYDRNNNLIAQYSASTNIEPPAVQLQASGYRFETRALLYFEPVQQAGNRLGTLVLRASLDALSQRLRLYTAIVSLIAACSLLMAYLFSTRMQKRISQPILVLAETARCVSARHDYSVRAKKLSHDEVGLLTDSFNQMLEQIQESGAELRAAHEQISHHAGELEKTVDERTAKLQQTIGELEAFSYSISHDMRAPLRVMSRYAQILVQDAGPKLDSTEQGYLHRIISGAQRLDTLIQDALTYSRVSRSEIKLQGLELTPLICSIVDQYPQLQPAEADLQIKSPLHNVLGHEASLSQCLSNLLVNAAKFVSPGQRPRITIWTEEVDSQIRVCIQDNGIGIAPEDQQRIFGIFSRVHSEKVYEGTGIGLAIVRKAVERMQGRVGVESEPGKGSVFWLELERGEVNEPKCFIGGR